MNFTYLILTSSKGTTTKLSWRVISERQHNSLGLETNRSTSTAACQYGQLGVHLRLPRQAQESLTPEVIGGAIRVILQDGQAGGNNFETYNFTARLGASRSKGGTRPYGDTVRIIKSIGYGFEVYLCIVGLLCIKKSTRSDDLRSFL